MKSHPDWSQEQVYTVFFPETFKPKKKEQDALFYEKVWKRSSITTTDNPSPPK